MNRSSFAAACWCCAVLAACGRSLPGQIERTAAPAGEVVVTTSGGTPNFPSKPIEQKY